ncbi:DUF6615 family protein [Mesorhizobium sp.]|uniref:DUF6615 family protein n=1 Tax=Mesorhizobium sp. TaxID=1871066 RepID=UPI000FE5A930|nr:DUF6615 family protein [Mesorhizobium sp.]RWM17824.1 MAG: hypothetical protein EOR74_33250 [Mesorhizobium sp.]
MADAVSRNLHLSYGCDISYGEETITESCLLEIWRRHSPAVHIETFTKRQEARNGADWEWHLIGRTYTFKMRVQAKRLARNGKKFRSLFTYKVATAPSPQVDMLIRGASARKLKPVLCFYSPEVARSRWTAGKMPRGLEAGCLVGDASKIKISASNDLASLELITIPWHYLVCPRKTMSRDFPSVQFLNEGDAASEQDLPEYIVPTPSRGSARPAEVGQVHDIELGVIGRVKIDCRGLAT